MKLLDSNFKTITFEEYNPSLSLIKAGKKLGKLYNNLNTTEIWDVTTINSTLKQVHYYYQAGLINTETALELCKLTNSLIQSIQKKLISNKNQYQIYYNELHLMNNNVLVTSLNKQLLYVPFTLLSYYKTEDEHTCKEANLFLNKQLNNSKLLNSSGEKEQNFFFNKLYKKIESLKSLIKANDSLDFQ